MTKGTTPTHRFKLPFTAETLEFTVTYAQKNPHTNEKTIAAKKTNADCIVNGDTIEVSLTQEDTLKFVENRAVEIQIKAKEQDGNVIASKIMISTVKEILDEEVL